MSSTTPDTTAEAGEIKQAGDTIIEQAEGLFEQAKSAVSDAFDATLGAVKQNPVAAAAIAGGAAAAIAGAAFGASKLIGKDEPASSGKSAK